MERTCDVRARFTVETNSTRQVDIWSCNFVQDEHRAYELF